MALLPVQTAVGPLIVAFSPLETVTVAVAVTVQLPLPAITEYVVVIVGEIVIAAVVAPVFQI